jgi:hypothetical protein
MYLSPRRLARYKNARANADLQHRAYAIFQMLLAQSAGAHFVGK